MEEELQQNQANDNKAGILGIGCSVLFPLIGVIIYFVQKKSVNNPKAYLYGALTGFIIQFVLQMIASTNA
jgi:hypothetical protein